MSSFVRHTSSVAPPPVAVNRKLSRPRWNRYPARALSHQLLDPCFIARLPHISHTALPYLFPILLLLSLLLIISFPLARENKPSFHISSSLLGIYFLPNRSALQDFTIPSLFSFFLFFLFPPFHFHQAVLPLFHEAVGGSTGINRVAKSVRQMLLPCYENP